MGGKDEHSVGFAGEEWDRRLSQTTGRGDGSRFALALGLSLLVHSMMIGVVLWQWSRLSPEEKGVASGPDAAIAVTLVAAGPAPYLAAANPSASAVTVSATPANRSDKPASDGQAASGLPVPGTAAPPPDAHAATTAATSTDGNAAPAEPPRPDAPSPQSTTGAAALTAPGGGNPRQPVTAAPGRSSLSNYLGEVLARIRQQAAREAGRVTIDGTSYVTFAVNAGGVVSSMHISKGSGYSALDKMALDIVKRAAPFPAIPPELNKQELLFDVPINFKAPA
jgi:periplasmic protein TonB